MSFNDQLKILFYTDIKKKEKKKWSLKTVNHHREGIYTPFKLELSALTEVILRVPDRIPLKQIFRNFIIFLNSLFYAIFYLCGA